MSPILAIMLVAACDPDLIHCAPLTHWNAIWRTVADCRTDQARVVEIAQREHGTDKYIMTTCRLTVDDDGSLRATLPLREPAMDARALF